MKTTIKTLLLVFVLALLSLAFMFYDVDLTNSYALDKRTIRLTTIFVVGISIAYSALIFQTLTGNRILTPSIMGYESVFILFQTCIVFAYGDQAYKMIGQEQNFFLAAICMLGFSMALYTLLFSNQKKGMYFLLLIGMIFSTLFLTLSQYLQILIDPNQFSVIQNYMFVSFSKMNTKLLSIAIFTLILSIAYISWNMKYLDVIALGKEHAINLGVDYQKTTRKFLLIISLLVSISTALVGPLSFLGILVCNLTYELFKTRKHQYMLPLCGLIACICLVAGQFLVEHVLQFSTTVSIIINFIGGLYFMYILWITRKRIS